MRRLVVVLVLLAGCFSPKLGDQPFLCGAAEPRCPADYVCDPASNRCVREGTTVADAAVTPDGPIADAAGFDATTAPDAPGTPDAPIADARVIDAPGADAPGAPDAAAPDASAPDARPIDASTADAASCIAHCEGDALITCSPEGTTTIPCPAGCDAQANPPACFILAPQYLPETTCKDKPGAGPLFPAGVTLIDTTACLGGVIVSQSNGAPDLCVLEYANVSIPTNAIVRFEGSRIPALVSTSNLIVLGRIDVAGNLGTGGPGSAIGAPEQGGAGQAMAPPGGGGGGAATKGAIGGAPATEAGGSGGDGHADGPEIRAGGHGGPGGDRCGFAGCPKLGGGGGGGLYLVACGNVQLGTGAVVNAGGGGGPGGEDADLIEPAYGGDGGGAGGDIVVEASQVLLNGGAAVGAIGGGGGAGGTNTTNLLPGAMGKPGSNGFPGAVPSGGTAPAGAGDGGNGGTGIELDRLPEQGGRPTSTLGGGGGGGGGAAGRIRAYARPDRPIVVPSGTLVTPKPTLGAINRTH